MRTPLLALLGLLAATAAQAGVATAPPLTSTSGTVYYVSAIGSDSNNGTSPATPWQTFGKVSGGTVAFHPGDRILFRGGDTFTGGNWTFQPTGGNTSSAANPIIISSYGGTGGKATLSLGNAWGIVVQDMDGVWLTHIAVNGSGTTTNLGSGWSIYNATASTTRSNFVVDDVSFTGWGSDAANVPNGAGCGIWIGPSGTTSLLSNIRVTNVVAHDNSVCGIVAQGWNVTTTYTRTNANGYFAFNSLYNNKGVAGTTSANPTGSGMVIGGFAGLTVEYNVAHDNGGVDNQTGGSAYGIWGVNNDSGIWQYNEVYNQKTLSNFDGGGFDLDVATTNSIMQYNYSHDNYGPGFAVAEDNSTPFNNNNTIRYNISQNDVSHFTQGALHLANVGSAATNVSNTQYYNNVVYLGTASNAGAIGMKVEAFSTNTKIWNNILISAGGRKLLSTAGSQTGLAIDANDYWPSGGAFSVTYNGTTYSSLATYQTGSSQEAHGKNADPLLTSAGGGGAQNAFGPMVGLVAYKLQTGSPMIDAGLNLNALFSINPGTHDFYGAAVPQGGLFDIGANEYVSAAPPPPPPGFLLIMPAGSSLIMPAGSSLVH